jgi:hypothetical protein
MAEEFKRRAAGWNAVEGGGRTWLHSAFCSQGPDCMLLKYTKPVPSVALSFRLAILWALPALV